MKMYSGLLRRAAALLLSGLCATLFACTEFRTLPEETLGSFEVTIDWDATPVPGDPYAQCTFLDATDLCPGATGTEEAPVNFPGTQWAQVLVDIQAIGTLGTKPFAVTAPVSLSVPAGEIFGQTRQIVLTDGVAEDVRVRVRRTTGQTRVWVEDNLPRFDDNDGAPTFSAGVSNEAIWFGRPRIADIQTTLDECCNPMQGQHVEIGEGELYITSIVGNGFNIQDVSTPQFGGLYVFAFRGIEGLRVGSKIISLSGGITEFQSSTQLTEPTYVPVNGLCAAARITPEGGQDAEDDEGGAARARCPVGAECLADSEGVERCTPDSDDSLDGVGRRVCVGDGQCPNGTTCQAIEGQGSFCQVAPIVLSPEAFPSAPYCGPTNTQSVVDEDGVLAIEALEGSLVKIDAPSALGARLSGLPVCRDPGGDDPLRAVRSTCNLTQANGEAVKAVDCTIANPGDPILRDDDGRPCFRGNQACLQENPGQSSDDVRSTCNDDPTLRRCEQASPGDPVLEDSEGRICRNTLDDFLTSGFQSFSQSKVFFEDDSGETRCATVNFSALTGFDPIATQEDGIMYRSITGTLRQVRFRSATSYWMVDVRFPEDLEPL